MVVIGDPSSGSELAGNSTTSRAPHTSASRASHCAEGRARRFMRYWLSDWGATPRRRAISFWLTPERAISRSTRYAIERPSLITVALAGLDCSVMGGSKLASRF